MEKIDIDKIIKLSIVASVLLIGFSLFYYLVIFLPQKEQNRIDLQKQERLVEENEKQAKIEQQKNKEIEEQKEKEEAERNLTNCLTDAEDSYYKSWSEMCKRLGKLSKECEEILFADTYGDYLEKHPEFQPEHSLDAIMGGHEKFMEKRNECSCLLPTHHADTFDKRLQENKNECYKKYPQK